MSRKKPKPNYDLMFQSAVTALQTAYNEYKNTMMKALRQTWYGDDGNYAELNTALNSRQKAGQLIREVDRLKEEVERLRRLMEGEEE